MRCRTALLAAAAFAAAAAHACPRATEVAQAHVLGTWQAEVEGEPQRVVLRLAKHPEFAESLRGNVERGGVRAALAGDVGDGELTLEESENGRTISATWLGDVEEGSCGRVIRGTWKREGDEQGRAFVLRKVP